VCGLELRFNSSYWQKFLVHIRSAEVKGQGHAAGMGLLMEYLIFGGKFEFQIFVGNSNFQDGGWKLGLLVSESRDVCQRLAALKEQHQQLYDSKSKSKIDDAVGCLVSWLCDHAEPPQLRITA